MKPLIARILILILLLGCGSDDTIPSRKEYNLYQSASVLVETFDEEIIASIGEGEDLVFEYRFISENDPDISDEEYSNVILFEIDPLLNEFSVTDAELQSISAYFTRYCFCNLHSIPISNGSIHGTKLSTTKWNISIHVTVDLGFDDTLNFSLDNEFNLVQD
ncbi:MAG: hypothetical protein KJO41_10845 [Bacteroidia bacterium]|nr:hypothetical protein [Bacteroidia bacterium]NNL32727.1 hypothetical protein [Flavobacteriaceae bacterium]